MAIQRGIGVRTLGIFVGLSAIAAACGGGGSLVDESAEKADAACACDSFECTTEYIKWFNEVSITREGDLAGLSSNDYDTYLNNSLRAADCQNELR